MYSIFLQTLKLCLLPPYRCTMPAPVGMYKSLENDCLLELHSALTRDANQNIQAAFIVGPFNITHGIRFLVL